MLSIALMNEKGGVGKTTLSINIACGLAIQGHRVLLVDSDAQANTTIGLGVKKRPGFYDLIVRDADFVDVIVEVDTQRITVPDEAGDLAGRLVIIPSNEETAVVSIQDMYTLRNRLRDVANIFDFVIIDTCPTPSVLNNTVLAAVNGVIYPTRCSTWSMTGLGESLANKNQHDEQFRIPRNEPPISVLGIVPVMYRSKTVEHQENLKQLRQHFGGLVWNPIPQAILWDETAAYAKSIFALGPETNPAKRMWKLIDTMKEVMDVQ